MLKLYSCENPLTAGHLKNILENNGISCIIKNESLQSIAGEVPPIVAWPEIWICDSLQLEKAKSIINESVDDSHASKTQWECSTCNEINEGQFAICWRCNGLKS